MLFYTKRNVAGLMKAPFLLKEEVSSVQFSCSIVSDSATPRTAARQASLSIPNSQSLLKLMSIELVTPSNQSHHLSPPSPPAFNLSQHQGLFQWVSSLHQVAKVLEFELQHQSFQLNIQDGFPLGLTKEVSRRRKIRPCLTEMPSALCFPKMNC